VLTSKKTSGVDISALRKEHQHGESTTEYLRYLLQQTFIPTFVRFIATHARR
jgi:hypothetical protein